MRLLLVALVAALIAVGIWLRHVLHDPKTWDDIWSDL